MTVKIYPQFVYENPPTHFSKSVEELTESIHNAFHTFSSDTDALIKDLADKSPAKRNELYYCYKKTYDKDLKDVIEDKVGGETGLALQYLCLPIHYAEAYMLNNAMKGLGARERLIYPILCGRQDREIIKLKETYFEIFSEDLGVRLSRELGGDFERLIFWSIQGNEETYDHRVHTSEKAEADADAFYKAGQGSFWGTDEKSLFKIIALSPPKYLEEVNEVYVSKHERTLISALEAETSGDVEKAATFAVGMKLKPYETVATQIHHECEGIIFTDELGLTCTIIRYEGALKEVSEAFEKEYGQALDARIKAKSGGKYEKLMVTILDTVLG